MAKDPVDRAPKKPVKKKAPGRYTAAAGIVVDVVLTPAQGTRARVPAEALSNRRYRNLDADRQVGRTAWQWMTEVGEARPVIKRRHAPPLSPYRVMPIPKDPVALTESFRVERVRPSAGYGNGRNQYYTDSV